MMSSYSANRDLQWLLGTPLKEEHLHTADATDGPFKRRVLTRCSCCWGPLCKQST